MPPKGQDCGRRRGPTLVGGRTKCDRSHVVEDSWYAELRERCRPSTVRLLLIGESAPDPLDENRRFFYAPRLSRSDNLFRSVIRALYDASPGRAGDPKAPWLARLSRDGVFLIDLVPYPVNLLPGAERRRARRAHVAACVNQAEALSPAGIAVCHGPSFEVLGPALRSAGAPLLHSAAIPFPLGNWRARFVSELRAAVERLEILPPNYDGHSGT